MIKLNPILIDKTNQSYAVEITEKLCKPFCENASEQPMVDVRFMVDKVTVVGNTEYVRVKAQGKVTYVAQNSCVCNPSSKVFTEYFTVAFGGVTEEAVPTIAVEEGYVEPAYVNCYGVACGISYFANVTVKIPSTTR